MCTHTHTEGEEANTICTHTHIQRAKRLHITINTIKKIKKNLKNNKYTHTEGEEAAHYQPAGQV